MIIKNVIFSGGGLKGWGYIGTIKALNEVIPFDKIEQIIGVSIGAIFGLCYLLRILPEDLLDFAMSIDYSKMIDVSLDNIITNQSLLLGEKFTEKIKELISHKIDPDITFIELKKYSKVLFNVNALNITQSKLEYFNYNLTPNIKVIDAIRASSNLPFIFPSYRINNDFYYDGGIYNNCPVDLAEPLFTIAFDICTEQNKNESRFKLMDLFNCLITMSNNLVGKSNCYRILNNLFDDQAFNLNQTKDDIFNIYMHGYINTKEVIFKNYLSLN